MKLAEFSVKNYQFTIVIFVMIMAVGVNSLLTMPKAEDPTLKSTFNSVIVIYPGTSAADMESLVVDPIEEKVSSIDEIKKIVSVANDGIAAVRVEFVHEINDPQEKYNEVLREVNAIRDDLPADIFDIDVVQFTPEGTNIMQSAIMSETAPYKELEDQAEDLKRRLLKIKTLKNVETWAYPNRQVQVSLNIDKMAQFRIPLRRVMGVIQADNANIPAGTVEVGNRKFNVKTSGSYGSLEEIENTVINSSGAQVMYLKDIAEVEFVYEEETYLARLNGKRGVFVTATQKSGTNIFDVQAAMNPVIEKFSEELPANLTFEKSFDQAKSVSSRLLGLAKDFGIAIFLVLITLIPLGIRAAVIVMISIPLSLAIGLFGLDILGFGINQLSVVGLVVALGLLVDDSIVVVENISRFLREGYTRQEAAIKGTQQISLAVVGCTATLVFAFLPLNFLPESAGDFIRSMPMAVTVTVIASLFVSITIVPFLASLLLPREEHEEGNAVLRWMKRVINRSYSRVLHFSLRNPWVTLFFAAAIFVGSLALIPVIGISVFPKSEKPQFIINIETPIGTSLSETNNAARFVEKQLNKYDIVKNYATNVGRDNPRIYYNVIPAEGTRSNRAQIFVQLQDDTEVPVRTQLIDDLRNGFDDFPGAKIKVIEFEQGAPVEAPLVTRIYGDNLDSLRSLSLQIENVYKQTSGTIYVNNPLAAVNTDLRVKINKDKAGMLGISTAEIDQTIRMGITGLNIGTFKDADSEEYDINVGLKRQNYAGQKQFMDYSVFDKLFISSQLGTLIPLSQLATVEFEPSPNRILHYDQERYTSVSAFTANGYLTPEVNARLRDGLDKINLPDGYYLEESGEAERQAETFGGLGTIILVTVFGILAILILEFGTFKSSIIVLSVIPLGMIGAVGILYLTGNSLSFTAIVGIIALAGIEVKNSILLVDYTNFLRKEESMSIEQAIEVAGETRFIPIVLTTLTAIGGLTPLVLENSPLYSPLALVIIGGLISSLILTRIVTPVMYKLLPPRIG